MCMWMLHVNAYCLAYGGYLSVWMLHVHTEYGVACACGCCMCMHSMVLHVCINECHVCIWLLPVHAI